MHKLMRLFLTAFVATTIVISSLPAMAEGTDEEIAALLKADGRWLATSKEGADFIGYTDPDFTFYPPNAPFMDDRQQMIEYWDAVVKTPGLELTWAPDGALVAESGELGYTHGRYTLKTQADDGTLNVAKGKYVTVLRKQSNGEWRPLVDIFNADE